MPTPYDPSWDRNEREAELARDRYEEQMWQASVDRRAGRTTSTARRVGALLLVALLLWIYVLRYLI